MRVNIAEQADKLRMVASQLQTLSRAFYRTGQQDVAHELIDHAIRIDLTVLEIENAVSESIHQEYRESAENVGSIFTSILQKIEDQESAQ